MGLRQPTSTGAFFAQVKAGTERQKEAREKLKKPQAIGGSASAGTQMVAATTGAQQKAAENVQATGQQAGKDLTVGANAIGNATTTAIGGTATPVAVQGGSGSDSFVGITPPPAAPASTTTATNTPPSDSATAQTFTGGVSSRAVVNPEIKTTQDLVTKLTSDLQAADKALRTMRDPRQYKTLVSNKKAIEDQLNAAQVKLAGLTANVSGLGESGNVEAIESVSTTITNDLAATTAAIEKLNSDLATADAADRKKLLDEKARLEALLKTYQDKLTKENLGQISGPSDFEQQMFDREQLLAEDSGNVGKLAALFGRKDGSLRTRKYGALESQIYGKDLEAIQEAARAGLTELGQAERATDTALEGYTGQIETSKKAYEERLDKETKKLDLLKATPQELAGYTRKELTDIFGKDVDRLFTFSGTGDTATVSNTKVSETRKALEDRQSKLKDELAKLPGEKEKAQATVDTNYTTAESSIFGKGDEPGMVGKISSIENEIKEAMGKFDELNSRSMFTRKSGHSKEVNYYQAVINDLQNGYRQLTKLKNQAQSIKDNDKLSKQEKTRQLNQLKTDMERIARETNEARQKHRIG